MPRRKDRHVPNKTTRFWLDRPRCIHGWDCTACCWTLKEPSTRTVASRYRAVKRLPAFLTAEEFGPGDIIAWVVAPNPTTWHIGNETGIPVRLSHTCGNVDCYSVHHLRVAWHPAPAPAQPRKRPAARKKLTPAQERQIFDAYTAGTPMRVLATRYGVSTTLIYTTTHLAKFLLPEYVKE